MRPLTERWPKPVLPIDGKPVLATLLRDLAAAGIERVWVVSGHLGGQVEALVGDGSAWKLEARVVRQPEPLGSADAVRRALEAGAEPPLLVTAADTVFSPGDLGRAAASREGEAAGAHHGTPMRQSFIWRLVKRTAHRAGVRPTPCTCQTDGGRHDRGCPRSQNGHNLSRITPHTLRRTFGSHLLNRGLRLEIVSKLLGDASTVVTERAYAELLDDTARRELLRVLQQAA